MGDDCVRVVIETLKEEKIDLVITLPEEPTYALTEALRTNQDFTVLTAPSEGTGIAMSAGASLGGRNVVFITGIAGLMVGTWTLGQMSLMYGVPLLILASYRGDVGDRSGISGPQLFMFNQVTEPLLGALRVPFRIVDSKAHLRQRLKDGFFACHEYSTPLVLLLTGEVLWS